MKNKDKRIQEDGNSSSPLGARGHIGDDGNSNSPLGVRGHIGEDGNFSSPLGARGSCLGSKVSNMFYGALPIHFELARKLRDNQTEAEIFLWDHLSTMPIRNLRFKRQHPILYFIADFYCHKAKLVIEIDGGYHDIPEQYKYDKARECELEELGLKVIRFTNEQVLFDIENTLKEIEKEVKKRTPNP